MFTETAKVTWDKIIETVFMALLATAIGTALAIPVSFIAARNLMAENKSPLTSIAFSIIGWPIGIYLGIKTAGFARQFLTPLHGKSSYSCFRAVDWHCFGRSYPSVGPKS